jgi:histidyl-tRNA synthetase
MIKKDYKEVVVPVLWEQQTFIDKAGPEIINQMWAFQDKGDRDVCLIPEVTALLQEKWRTEWSKTSSSKKIFYVSRCYRYERPQEGRYREFTQLGVEYLGTPKNIDPTAEVCSLLRGYLDWAGVKYEFKDSVKRGLSYYVENGFEVECAELGAQKQIAGGGKYAEGIGWAIGLERLMLACEKQDMPHY